MLGLVSKGLPWEVVINTRHDERLAFAIAIGIFEGGEFDWAKMEWLPPKTK